MARGWMRTAIVLACLLLTRGAFAADALARVRQTGVLRWGGDLQGGEPYVSQDPRDPSRLVGFEVEIASGIARALGVRAQFVESDWSTLVPSLERGGSFDVAMNGIEVMPSRSARVAFTRPYYVFAERLVARKGDARVHASLEGLRGLRVGTLASSFAFELVRERAEVVPYEGVQEPYLDLEHGRTDAVLLDDIIAARYGEPNPALAVVGDVAEGYYAVAVPKTEPALRDAVDGAIATMATSGELETILRRAGLWSAREERLARWTNDDQARMVSASAADAPAPSMTPRHALLFLQGALMTLLVSTLAMTLAVPLGLGLAIARRWGPSWAATLATGYVEIYRGTPVLLQLYVLYYGLAPIVRVGALTAAVVGLGMNYAAYEAEAYRAGIQAVPRGQTEAALSLGMSLPLLLRRIVLPQAFRHALPNVTNDFIALLKDSSLVSVITVVELTKQMTITAVDVRGWLAPGALCAALYLAMSWPLSFLARRIEARLARS
jgi:polar amino acid transport system substrate-binding protein